MVRSNVVVVVCPVELVAVKV
jgi:hypothetical protein